MLCVISLFILLILMLVNQFKIEQCMFYFTICVQLIVITNLNLLTALI